MERHPVLYLRVLSDHYGGALVGPDGRPLAYLGAGAYPHVAAIPQPAASTAAKKIKPGRIALFICTVPLQVALVVLYTDPSRGIERSERSPG